jgi:hypothetical protein
MKRSGVSFYAKPLNAQFEHFGGRSAPGPQRSGGMVCSSTTCARETKPPVRNTTVALGSPQLGKRDKNFAPRAAKSD